jgi:hypothetical protein
MTASDQGRQRGHVGFGCRSDFEMLHHDLDQKSKQNGTPDVTAANGHAGELPDGG